MGVETQNSALGRIQTAGEKKGPESEKSDDERRAPAVAASEKGGILQNLFVIASDVSAHELQQAQRSPPS